MELTRKEREAIAYKAKQAENVNELEAQAEQANAEEIRENQVSEQVSQSLKEYDPR